MLRRALSFTLLLTACAATPHAAPSSGNVAPPAAASPADAALDRLFQEEWDETLAADPVTASMLGDRRWNDQWPDFSLAAVEHEHVRAAAALKRLHAIPREQLSDAQKLHYD